MYDFHRYFTPPEYSSISAAWLFTLARVSTDVKTNSGQRLAGSRMSNPQDVRLALKPPPEVGPEILHSYFSAVVWMAGFLGFGSLDSRNLKGKPDLHVENEGPSDGFICRK
jgi:hypothetical protein